MDLFPFQQFATLNLREILIFEILWNLVNVAFSLKAA